jgi:hypothetical protein
MPHRIALDCRAFIAPLILGTLALSACGERPAADAPPAENTGEMAAPVDTGMGGMSHDSAMLDTTMARPDPVGRRAPRMARPDPVGRRAPRAQADTSIESPTSTESAQIRPDSGVK